MSAAGGETVPLVLVVDDDDLVRRLFVRALRAAGYETREARDGEEALAAVRERAPHVLVLDSRMPRLDGLAVLARLRADAATRMLPIVMVTGSGDLDDRVAGLDAGADDYLTKPLHVDELVARVRAQLRRSGAPGQESGAQGHVAAPDEFDALLGSRAFRAVFQPIVLLADRSVLGYEALTRFDDGRSPTEWFAAAEALGRRAELERATLELAIDGAGALPPGRWLSVNVSCALLAHEELPGILAPLDRPLVLELTEHERVDDYDALRAAIAALVVALTVPVRLAVDDAGAGFASLRHILDLGPHVIKLDLSWIRDIDGDPPRQTLVAGLVRFAEETGAVTVAEGIETEAEEGVVRSLGVTEGQGYRFGRPAPVDDLSRP